MDLKIGIPFGETVMSLFNNVVVSSFNLADSSALSLYIKFILWGNSCFNVQTNGKNRNSLLLSKFAINQIA